MDVAGNTRLRRSTTLTGVYSAPVSLINAVAGQSIVIYGIYISGRGSTNVDSLFTIFQTGDNAGAEAIIGTGMGTTAERLLLKFDPETPLRLTSGIGLSANFSVNPTTLTGTLFVSVDYVIV